MSCIAIIVLVVICVITLFSFMNLEQSYLRDQPSPPRKYTYLPRAVPVREPFMMAPTTPPPSSDLHDLITNGSFADRKEIQEHYGKSQGSRIITRKNPGKSGYVLEQTGRASYHLRVKTTPGLYYMLFCWVCDTNPDQAEELYYIKYEFSTSPNVGHAIQATSGDSVNIAVGGKPMSWVQKKIIFQSPHDSNGIVDIGLQYKGTIGPRYITGVAMVEQHPELMDFPYHQWVAFFLSSYNPKSYSKGEPLAWNDLSNHKRHFSFSIPAHIESNAIALAQTKVGGPPCSDLGLKLEEFTLGWHMTVAEVPHKSVFLTLYTSYDKDQLLKISYESDYRQYCTLSVSLQNKTTSWNIGLVNIPSLFQLVHKTGTFTLNRDGVTIPPAKDASSGQETYPEHDGSYGLSGRSGSSEPTGNSHRYGRSGSFEPTGHSGTSVPTGPSGSYGHTETSGPSDYTGPTDAPTIGVGQTSSEHFTTQSDAPHFTNIPLKIGPFNGNLSDLFAYNKALTEDQLRKVHSYFQCTSCKGSRNCQPDHPTPPPSHVVPHIIHEEQEIITEEEEVRKQRCRICLHKEDTIIQEEEAIQTCEICKKCKASLPIAEQALDHINQKINQHAEACDPITTFSMDNGRLKSETRRLSGCQACEEDDCCPQGLPSSEMDACPGDMGYEPGLEHIQKFPDDILGDPAYSYPAGDDHSL